MLNQTDRLDKTEPALIVKYGNTAKRYLALDRKSVVMGRARGCDIELDAPDVSLVHCVVSRGPNGLFIRDCGSRVGTKVNGIKVQEAVLHNGDIVLIGMFSFEVYLPWQSETADIEAVRQEVYKEQLKRLEKSRERLTNLALAMRRRLHEERSAAFGVATAVSVETNTPIPEMGAEGMAAPSAETLPDKPHQLRAELDKVLTSRQEEMTKQLQSLDERVRAYDQKLVELEQREQTLNASQVEFDQRQQQQEQAAREIVEARAEFEGRRDMVVRELLVYRDHVARAREQLEEIEGRRKQATRNSEEITTTGPLPEEVHRLDLRQHELDCFARYLRRTLVKQRHEQARYGKALAELQSLLTEACQYQRVGLETLQDARESLLRVRDEADRDFT